MRKVRLGMAAAGCISVLYAVVIWANSGTGADTRPVKAKEVEVPARPTRLLGKATVLMVGERMVGKRRYYITGQLYEEKEYKGDVLHGRWRRWHANGQLASERLYTSGVIDGV